MTAALLPHRHPPHLPPPAPDHPPRPPPPLLGYQRPRLHQRPQHRQPHCPPLHPSVCAPAGLGAVRVGRRQQTARRGWTRPHPTRPTPPPTQFPCCARWWYAASQACLPRRRPPRCHCRCHRRAHSPRRPPSRVLLFPSPLPPPLPPPPLLPWQPPRQRGSEPCAHPHCSASRRRHRRRWHVATRMACRQHRRYRLPAQLRDGTTQTRASPHHHRCHCRPGRPAAARPECQAVQVALACGRQDESASQRRR